MGFPFPRRPNRGREAGLGVCAGARPSVAERAPRAPGHNQGDTAANKMQKKTQPLKYQAILTASEKQRFQ